MTIDNPPVFDNITTSVGNMTGDELRTSLDSQSYDAAGNGARLHAYYREHTGVSFNGTTFANFVGDLPAGLDIVAVLVAVYSPIFYVWYGNGVYQSASAGNVAMGAEYKTSNRMLTVRLAKAGGAGDVNLTVRFIVLTKE